MRIIIITTLGLCIGSFLNALIWRLKTGRGIAKERSICPHCKHRLKAEDLVPVLSWIELRGKCRYCHKKIGWQYPLVEISTAALFVLSYIAWPHPFGVSGTLALLVWLACTSILMALFVYDLRWMLLPDKLVVPLTLLAACLVGLLSIATANPGAVYGPFIGGVFLSGLFYALFQVSDGKWIGGGDVKIGLALGLLAGGFFESVLLLFLASLLGTLVAVPLLLTGKSKSHKVPFGPFLIVATYIVFMWGIAIIGWYQNLIGL